MNKYVVNVEVIQNWALPIEAANLKAAQDEAITAVEAAIEELDIGDLVNENVEVTDSRLIQEDIDE